MTNKTIKEELTIPSVHLNGSGYDNLYRDYRAAIKAVQEARSALPVPHGRDYYVQEDGAFEKARAQFEDQRRKLNEIEEQLSGILMGVLEQHRG